MALKWLFGRGGDDAAKGPPPNYEEAKKVAAGKDSKARAKLASNPSLQPEFLYFFATDGDASVRGAVAKNKGTPIQADVILARDPSADVKVELAQKVGRLLPTLSSEENRKVTDMVLEVVETLAQASEVKVRAKIADQIKSLDTIPPRIATRLAQDVEEVVSSPVLEFSPLLTDEDLAAIIASGCRGPALAAMARRKTLSEPVSSSIAETNDQAALPELIRNKGADLSEETLSAIVDAAEENPKLHGALADRGGLKPGLLRRMASFVSGSTLEKLIENNVLVDGALERELRDTVAASQGEDESDLVDEDAIDEDKAHEEERRARDLHERGALDRQTMLRAVEKKEREFVIHGLALLSETKSDTIRRLLTAKDAKLPVSIAWHCKLGFPFALALEKHMMDLSAPIKKAEGGGYPMSEDDMAWALEVAGVL